MIANSIAHLGSPPGGDSSLVPEGVRIAAMVLEANTGMLRLSLVMTSLPEDQEAEALMVEQLRLSLTELPSVTSLQVVVNGSVAFLPRGYYIGRPFSR
jgi:spore germination protein GerM